MDIAVIGLGLIGGSLAHALAGAGHRVLGYDADPSTRAVARTAAAQAGPGRRWQVAGTVRDAVAGAELTVLAVPLPAVGGVLDELARLRYSGLVTDVTSVKGAVRELAATRLVAAGQRLAGFVGGHPMAGRETSGFAAADPDLFRGCAWVLCLEPDTDLGDWLDLAALVTSLGARAVPTSAADHDHAVAAISHVPHLVAAALVRLAADDPMALTLAAGSFRDGTRVAASPASLTAAMCGGNADATGAGLDSLLASLSIALAALDSDHPIDALVEWLAPAQEVRSAWPPSPSEAAELPARADILLRLGKAGGWVVSVADDRRSVTAVRPV